MGPRTPLARVPGAVWAVAAVVGVAAAAWPLLLVVGPNADDGLVGAHAMLVADGAIPHRDYFSPIWPGADLLYGAWFRLVGASYPNLRLLTLLGLLGGTAALFGVGRRLLPDGWAFAVALLWGGWTALFLDRGPYHVLSPAAMVAMTWAILRGSRAGRPWAWYLVAGALGGAGTLLLQSRGIAALAGVGAAAVVAAEPLRGAMQVAAGGGLPALGAVAWLVATGALGPFLHQSFSFAAGSYLPANFRGIPRFPGEIPGVLNSHPYAIWLLRPGVWLAGLVAPVLVTLRLAAEPLLRRRRRWRREAVAVAVVGAGMLVSGLYRPAAAVLWSSAPLALVLGAAALRGLRWPPAPVRTAVGAGTMALLVLAAVLPAGALALQRVGVGPGNPPDPLDPIGGRLEAPPPTGAAVEAVLSFARERPEEAIAFLPAIKAMYLLSGRPPPLPYVIVRRGYNTERQVREAMSLLEERRVRWIVYAPWLRDFGPPREETWVFDRFLEERYVLRGELGQLRFGPLLLYEAAER